jgi:ankyrin repeat protein
VAADKDSDPHTVEDYIDCFETISKHLLNRVVNLDDKSGNTAIHYAISHNNFDIVSVLLDSKVCDVNKTNKVSIIVLTLVNK